MMWSTDRPTATGSVPPMTTLTLTEFLRLRFNEHEQYANLSEELGHISKWEHLRELADLAAKRRIVEQCLLQSQPTSGYDLGQYVLAEFAWPYADHADYRQEWKP